MAFYRHVETFAGLRVVEFGAPGEAEVTDPREVAWRLSVEFDDSPDDFAAQLDRLVALAGPSVTALVIGEWGGSNDNPPPVDALVARAAGLPNLKALFIGDLTVEENEVSWLAQDDPSPLPAAFPALEHLVNRGTTGWTPVTNKVLRKLVLESGGLHATTVRAVGESDLPSLTHLELWLGDVQYGGDADVDDLAQILGGARLPALRYLGLRDSMIADEVAAAVASAPVVARLEVLDLSMGVLGDEGARALLAGQPLTHLRELRLAHHFMSDEMAARLVAELPGVAVDVSDPQEDRGYRFVAVSE